MLVDKITLEGWGKASFSPDVDACIHPAGVDKMRYIDSGQCDALNVLKWVKPTDYVMDYGCGNGRVLQFIPNKKVGIDAVRSMANFVVLPQEFHEKVDVIYSISVFIHNTQKTGVEIIKWMREHIKPGGLMLLQIPIYDKHRDPQDWTDVGVWTEQQFRDAVKGLEILELHTNKGEFSFEKVGENHSKFQVVRA